MSDFEINETLFISVTPAGAYHAVSSPVEEPARHTLLRLLTEPGTPAMSADSLCRLTGESDPADAQELFYRLQSANWITGIVEPEPAPSANMDKEMPALLQSLTDNGKTLLADSQGFYLASQGFPHEAAEELSALSADIASLNARHHGLLHNNLRLYSSAWGIIDAAGDSQVGFWPLYIGDNSFVLILMGVPMFNHKTFRDLVWALCRRYLSADSIALEAEAEPLSDAIIL